MLCICVSILNQPLLLFLLLQPLSDKKHFDKEEHNADYGKSDVILFVVIAIVVSPVDLVLTKVFLLLLQTTRPFLVMKPKPLTNSHQRRAKHD